MTEKERVEFQKYVARTSTERARTFAMQLARSTTLGSRFDLTDVKTLESFLLNSFWIFEHAEVSPDTEELFLTTIIAGKDCG